MISSPRIRIAFLFLDSVIISILLSFSAYGEDSHEGTIVQSGVIFSAQQTEQIALDQKWTRWMAPPYWTPNEQDISALEQTFAIYLRSVPMDSAKTISEHFNEYRRQYFAYTLNGERWIFVNALCDARWKGAYFWRVQFISVSDGGACYFHFRYNVTKSQVHDLDINGES
jgi:hypothetical protein